MWKIAYIDIKKNSKKYIRKLFLTNKAAYEYINDKMKDKENVWVEEVTEKENVEIKQNSWLWMYSKKKRGFFPYGIVKQISSNFIEVQTKEDIKNEDDYVDIRKSRIKDMLNNDILKIQSSGYFVKLNEYM